MGKATEKAVVVAYLGDGDVVEWLDEVCETEPLLVPEWPDSDAYAVFVVGYFGNGLSLIRVFEKEATMALLGPHRLWFCHVPRELADTMTEKQQ